MDEIIDYLMWKHKRSIEQSICLISGFLLGSAWAEFHDPERSLIRLGSLVVFIGILLLVMFVNDRPRTYHLPEDDTTPASYR